ncbi:MAG TPA: hypothetical protein VMO88_10580 [Acidimicrobiales bacterium]|nr:hypothetical protein [Acidimicrobiales bacterium]
MDLVARGEDVVLIVACEAGTDADDSAKPAIPPCHGPGRLAVLVGDAADPATVAAAEEMDNELFSTRR